MGADISQAGGAAGVSKTWLAQNFRPRPRGARRVTDQYRRSLPGSILGVRDFRQRRRPKDDGAEGGDDSVVETIETQDTPEDALAAAYRTLRANLEAELLDQVRSASPVFFERLVIDLLVAMGYGGSRKDAGQAIGRSGDDGIDGIIKEDRLGLDTIYVQAKRWDGIVGRPEIQKFAGALQGQRANKGVFLTTSGYSRDAEDYVSRINSRIILIDGQTLARLMVDFGVGVARAGAYEVKRVDSDYFDGDLTARSSQSMLKVALRSRRCNIAARTSIIKSCSTPSTSCT